MKTKFQSRVTEEVMMQMAKAKIAGLLYIETQERTNLECDQCGKNQVMNYVVVGIHTDKETMVDDPISGDMFTFGQSCWNKIATQLKAQVTFLKNRPELLKEELKYEYKLFDGKREEFEAGKFVGQELQKGNLLYDTSCGSSDYSILSISPADKKNLKAILTDLNLGVEISDLEEVL